MKIRYKGFTTLMKALFWGSVVLTLINFTCLFITMNPSIIPGGQFFIGSAISLFLTCVLLTVLAVKILRMNRRDK